MANLMLGLLGPLQVTLADAPISGFESDKARALLAFLAVEADRPHRREALIGILWPDCPEPTARHNLSQTLMNVRQTIGDYKAKPPYFLITRDEIQFNTESDSTLDIARFNTLYNSGDKDASGATRTVQLEKAVALYRGKFLQEFFLEDSAEFEEWALVQREALHQRALDALAYLANYYEQHGDFPAARRHLARQLELDPWREEAHHQMMRVLAQDGQASAALVQYETCRRVLADELGVEPSAETRELYEQIRSGIWKSEVGNSKYTLGTSHFALPTSNLPSQLTPFIGRERELTDLGRLIADPMCRCISLVGTGGIGKTRLALQVAANLRRAYTHGVIFVPLAPLSSPASIVPAIADALGFAFYGPNDPQVQLLNYMRDKQILLVMDNVEHLLSEGSPGSSAADIFIAILQHDPQVKLLITSREILNLSGEWVFPVEGLTMPPLSEDEAGERFDDYAAVALFVQHARRARAGFVLNVQDRTGVARLCHLVEGHPLALELAATWVRTLSVSEIAQEIERNLDFLSASLRDLPERHRSIRVVFDHSWQMLAAEEQQLLGKLSVFRSGFRREAAEQVAGASLSSLSALVIRSLVRRTPTGRYDLHELIRQYAADQLRKNPEEEMAIRDQHSEYYLGNLFKREAALGSARQKDVLAELTPEMHNLRLAWRWAARRGNTISLREAAWSFWWHYELRNLFREWSEVFQESLQELQRTDHLEPDRQVALGLLESYQALLVARQGHTGQVRQHLWHCLEVLRPHQDTAALAEALAILALACWFEGTFADAALYAHEAHELAETTGRRWQQVASTAFIGIMEYELGNYAEADRWLADGLAQCRVLGDARLISLTTGYQSRNARALGHIAEMESLLRDSLRLATEINDRNGIGVSLEQLAQVAQSKGDRVEAERLSRKSIAAYREICDDWCLARVLNQTGYFALEWDDPPQAQACFQEALQIGVRANITPLALDALAGIGFLLAKKGSNAWALELVTHVLQHPAATHAIRARAEQLRAELESRLTPQQFESVQAQTKNFDQVVSQTLGQSLER